MPKVLKNALNPKTVNSLSKPGTYADGSGLALKVDDRGNRRWVWRGKVNGKAAMRGLGSYPAVSLADARKAAVSAQQVAAEAAPVVERPRTITFSAATQQFLSMMQGQWKNAKHSAQWRNTLSAYAYPVIGSKTVEEIATGDVLAVLEPIWMEKSETANRVRQRMEKIFDWAILHNYREKANPATKAILVALPNVRRMKEHHRALPYRDVPATIRRVRRSNARPLMRLAFEFLVLTASCSGEVRLADWSEIDWNAHLWVIPAVRMKAGREHRVPLPDRAMEILRDAWELSGPDGCIFPGPRSGVAISDMGLTQLLRREKIDAVPHGFRSSFRDWAAEQSGAGWAVCEASLAHQVGNSVEKAYLRSDLLDQRRPLMQDWADYCSG